jgi:quercetin dioxygenase-like cupin family protein
MQRIEWFRALVIAVLLGLGSAVPAQSPPPIPGMTRTTLAQADLSVPGHETVVMRVELAPGAEVGWHTHPGEEISYLAQGELTLLIAGQPPQKRSAGQALIIPAGVVHNARSDGAVPAVIIAVYVVEKGKPLRSAAPAPAQ